VTLSGTAVSLAGGLLIGLTAAWLTQQWWAILIGGVGGLAGSLFDSFLGATVQQIYVCVICEKETEKKEHCGQATRPLKGWSWLNNDWVNFLASIFGGSTAVLLYKFLT